MKTKKMIQLGMTLSIGVLLVACGGTDDTQTKDSSTKESTAKTEDKAVAVESLNIMFVPSKNPDDIVTATEPLSGLVKDELKKEGIDVEEVNISVGTNYEAVGEALASGTADVGYGVPGGTFALYQDETDVILTATRAGLNKDSDVAKDWNDGKPTEPTDQQAMSYRSILVAGPSAKGQELAEKVNAGEELSWEDLNSAKWGVASTTSSAGYIYPSLWLNENVDKNISDIDTTVQNDSYGSGFARLASGQIDVMPVYADARRDFEEAWKNEYSQKDIWAETNIIGVTPPIYNDAVIVSKNSEAMSEAMKEALQNALINVSKTEAGKKVIGVYTHEGYEKATNEDYASEIKAQELMKAAAK